LQSIDLRSESTPLSFAIQRDQFWRQVSLFSMFGFVACAFAQHREDQLLGSWLCLADNVHQLGEVPRMVMTFKSDGTVILREKNRAPVVSRYRCEPAERWWKRGQRGQQTSPPNDLFDSANSMVSFAPRKSGKFMDWGGNMLILDPRIPMLYNPITQFWCRPGDKKRVLSQLKSRR